MSILRIIFFYKHQNDPVRPQLTVHSIGKVRVVLWIMLQNLTDHHQQWGDGDEEYDDDGDCDGDDDVGDDGAENDKQCRVRKSDEEMRSAMLVSS